MAEKKVLIIESDESFAKSLSSVFSGYQDVKVKVVGDGKDGLREAREGSYMLVLLSVELPKLSGYSICKKLKSDKQTRSIPLVIMSSEATEETFERHRKLKTRADEYIIKPFEPDLLLKKISNLIDLESQEDEAKESDLILIDDEESIVIDDLPDLDDDNMDLIDDDATVVKDASLISPGGEELEEFDDVLGDLEVPGDLESSDLGLDGLDAGDDLGLDELDPKEIQSINDAADIGEDEELEGFNDVLESLKEVEEVDEAEILDLNSDLDPVKPKDLPRTASLEAPVDEMLENLSLGDGVGGALPEPDLLDLPNEEDFLVGADLGADTASPRPTAHLGFVEQDRPLTPPPKMTAFPASESGSDPLLDTKLKEAEEENEVLRKKLSLLEQRIEETHRTYEIRETELGSLRTQATSKDKEFLALKATINSKDREILELKEECTRKDQQLLDVREKADGSEHELYRLRELVETREQEMKEISGRVESLMRQKNNLENAYQSKLAEWEEQYNSETARLEHQIQVMTEEHQKALTDMREELDETKRSHHHETAELKNQIEQLENEVKNLCDQAKDVDDLRSQIQSVQDRLQAAEEEKANYEQNVLKAYQKIKNDEKIKEKARKAVEIAMTLLADQVSLDDLDDQDKDLAATESDEAHT